MGRGYTWLDTGTHDSLLEAAEFISIIEKRAGLKIACIEEIAYINNWIDKDQLKSLAEPLMKNDYGKYLVRLVDYPDKSDLYSIKGKTKFRKKEE